MDRTDKPLHPWVIRWLLEDQSRRNAIASVAIEYPVLRRRVK